MLQIDRNMTQVEGSETEPEPQSEPAKQTKLSLKVINLSSHRLHVKFEHQLQSRSSRGSPLLFSSVAVYICLLSLRALYCFIMSLGVFIVSMFFPVVPLVDIVVSCQFHVIWSAIYAGSL